MVTSWESDWLWGGMVNFHISLLTVLFCLTFHYYANILLLYFKNISVFKEETIWYWKVLAYIISPVISVWYIGTDNSDQEKSKIEILASFFGYSLQRSCGKTTEFGIKKKSNNPRQLS